MGLIVALVVVFVVASLFFLIYTRQDRFRFMFKANLEQSFAEMTGAKVSIRAVSGNPFKKIIFKGLRFDFGRYGLDFDIARLEYSLFDIMSGKESAISKTETVMTLGKGSLRLENKALISRQIRGKIRLMQDKIILDKITFRVFDQLLSSIEGEIMTDSRPYRLKLIMEAEPFFDNDKPLFKKIRMSVNGPLDNLNLRGKIERPHAKDIHVSSYLIHENEMFNIGSRLGIEAEKGDINHIISMDAEVDIEKETFNTVLIPNDGRVFVSGDYSKFGTVKVDIENQHLKIFGFDFSNIVHLLGKVVFRDSVFSHFLIDIDTEASILNYSPMDEIASSFLIDKRSIRVIYLKIGDIVAASGNFNIKPPRKAQVKVNFSDFNLEMPFLLADKENPGISGKLSGEILISGLLSKPDMGIKLTAANGRFDPIAYDIMLINGDGTWPYLNIYDSRITHGDSSLMLEGELDLTKISDESFMDNVSITTDDNTIQWEGWDITNVDESREFSLKRGLSNGVSVGYKNYMDDETKYGIDKPRDEFQLEYDLLDDESVIEFRAKEDEEFLGFRKKYSF
ncbi:MAG: hypothetical protein RAP41_00315 [Candidatus Orphnella occulta]|nr:hypothetical protein [Candidatus Orphnella occulta]